MPAHCPNQHGLPLYVHFATCYIGAKNAATLSMRIVPKIIGMLDAAQRGIKRPLGHHYGFKQGLRGWQAFRFGGNLESIDLNQCRDQRLALNNYVAADLIDIGTQALVYRANGAVHMWERAVSDAAITLRELGERLGQDRERIRRNLFEMRQTAAGGRKLIAETLAMIAAAEALATPVYNGFGRTIEVSMPAPVGLGHPLLRQNPTCK